MTDDYDPRFTVTLTLSEIQGWGIVTTTPFDAAQEFLRMVRDDGHLFVYRVTNEEDGTQWRVDLGNGSVTQERRT